MSDLSDKLKREAAALAAFETRPELLLFLGIPPPMQGLAPRVVLGQEWWERTRRAAAEATGFRCAACGVSKWQAREHKWLEGHEVYEIDWKAGRMVYVETAPLCHFCHSFCHLGRLEMLVRAGKLSKSKQREVKRHGQRVLDEAGLERPAPPLRMARWERWRLVIDGAEHPPIYKNEEEWRKAFSSQEGAVD